MRYEHFGISIVELMSAGLITIAHNSGKVQMIVIGYIAGPKMDIIGKCENPVGYLADLESDYVEFVVRAINNYD